MGGTFSYEITEHIATQSEYESQNALYTTEINRVAFSGNQPKIDIRKWKHGSDGSTQLLKGIALSDDEVKVLAAALHEITRKDA